MSADVRPVVPDVKRGDRLLWWKPGSVDPIFVKVYEVGEMHASVVFDAPAEEGYRHEYRTVHRRQLSRRALEWCEENADDEARHLRQQLREAGADRERLWESLSNARRAIYTLCWQRLGPDDPLTCVECTAQQSGPHFPDCRIGQALGQTDEVQASAGESAEPCPSCGSTQRNRIALSTFLAEIVCANCRRKLGTWSAGAGS